MHNMLILPPTGVSDFSYERTISYPSYFLDSNGTYNRYDVSPEAHQAVLNEIAARPANFGYGLGYALRMAVEFIKTQLNGKNLQGKCTLEDKDHEETVSLVEECILATTNLQQYLSAVEKAEEENFKCLVKENMSPKEARLLQQAQRPSGLQSYPALFSSVGSGPYRTRKEVCKKEALESMTLVQQAEKAENEQQKKCSRR